MLEATCATKGQPLFVQLLATCVSIFWAASAYAQAQIKIETSNCPPFICGSGVSVYIDGDFDGTEAERLEALINDGHVPPYSTIYFNSFGGSLFGGMELGRIIRKHRFNTAVSKRSEAGESVIGGAVCMSACSLAYIGGVFRYFDDNDLFGVHRFYSNQPIKNEGELAQVISAAIISFLAEMDVPPDLFVEMTKAGSQSMRMLNQSQMLLLGIANNGIGRTHWTVKATEPTSGASVLYLVGERNTSFGINKMIFLCSPGESNIVTHIVFDPQGRTDEVLSMRAIRLEIDGELHPFAQFLRGDPEIVNGWLNASFDVPSNLWAEVVRKSEHPG
jgi:hypothetical protein